MWDQMRKPIRRIAIRGMIALIAASLFAATAGQHVLPLTKQRAYNVMQVAQIDEAPSTIGISDGGMVFTSAAEMNARLDLMQSLGVTNVRIQVSWASVQPLHPDTPFGLGAPKWDQLDMLVNAAAARGMGVLGVLNSTPLWATSSLPVNGQPKNYSQFADFAKSVALRYGSKVSAYEVWNEPNSIQFWNTLNPVAYTEMLKVTYSALKQAAAQIGTDITVIGGVVGAGMTMSGLTMNPVDFVRKMYEAGANGFFDALSFHSYNFEWKLSSGQSTPWIDSPLNQLNKIRALMDSYLTAGQEQVKIWITEYGLPTNVVSEATQAAFVKDLIEFWQTVGGAGPIFLHTIKDWLNPPAGNNEANFGIFRPDGTMKPVGQIIKDLIALLTKPPTNPGTGPGEGPGAGTPPAINPVAAIMKAIQKVVTSFNAMISKMLSGIFGKKPSAAQASAFSTAMAAAADYAPIAGPAPEEVAEYKAETFEPTRVKIGTETGSLVDDSATDKFVVRERLLVTEVPAGPVGADEEPAVDASADRDGPKQAPVEDVPAVDEVPVEEEVPVEDEVTEEAPADEVTEPETVEAPAKTDPAAETVNDKVTDDTDTTVTDADTTESPKNGTTARIGKRDGLAADSTDTATPAVRETSRPNLKARHEQGPRTPRANSESGQGAPSPAGQSTEASSPSGGAD